MINIIFKNIFYNNEIDLSKSSTIYLEISGHSGQNSKGYDIICSAVSALSQTFILSVARILQINQQISRNDGYLSSTIPVNHISAEDKTKLKLLIESLLIGILEINSEYPDRISIEFVND